MRPLGTDDVIAAASQALGITADDPQLVRAAPLAEGSVSRAIALMDGPLLTLREKIGDLLARLPETDPLALHALGDSLGRADDAAMTTFNDAIRKWLGEQVERSGEPYRLVRIADAWDKFNRAAADVEIYNTERKPLVFAAFGLLAEAARR